MRSATPSSCSKLSSHHARVGLVRPCSPATTTRCRFAFQRTSPLCAPLSSSTGQSEGVTAPPSAASTASSSPYNWTFPADPAGGDKPPADPKVRDVPLADIRRPLGRTRVNDAAKVAALMASIQQIGLQEPIDVLDVEGKLYGFSGCHRFEAHQKLGLTTIRCRVRRATPATLKMHLN